MVLIKLKLYCEVLFTEDLSGTWGPQSALIDSVGGNIIQVTRVIFKLLF